MLTLIVNHRRTLLRHESNFNEDRGAFLFSPGLSFRRSLSASSRSPIMSLAEFQGDNGYKMIFCENPKFKQSSFVMSYGQGSINRNTEPIHLGFF